MNDSEVEEERALQTRHNAAIALLRRGADLDGELLLSYVIWPTLRLEHVSALPRKRPGRRRGMRNVPVGA
jgi:hypothetical protein